MLSSGVFMEVYLVDRNLDGENVQREAKRYDHDGHSKSLGLRLLLLLISTVILAARPLAPPPQNERIT